MVNLINAYIKGLLHSWEIQKIAGQLNNEGHEPRQAISIIRRITLTRAS